MSLPTDGLVALIESFQRLFDRDVSDDEARAFLIEVSKPENFGQAIAPAAISLRHRLERDGMGIATPGDAIDVCGTGGDGKHTLNVSTAVALVVAACGVPVAKHGNRAASSLAGGADTLEALGLNLEHASARAEATLADLGIAFLFAQKHHPAFKWLAPIRKDIGTPTVLNYVGPLCNPAHVRRQLIGVPNKAVFDEFKAIPWDMLKSECVMVVCGAEGLDELSISGASHVYGHGFAAPAQITPEDAGLSRHPLAALKGGDAVHNATALRRLLMGETETRQDLAYRDAVLLNAAGALIVAGEVHGWREGVKEARLVLKKRLAMDLLDCWIASCG